MKKSDLNKIIKEIVKEQYDFGSGLEPDLGLGDFGMGSYCSGPSPCDTYNSEQACEDGPGCEWQYGQTGSSFGSSIDVTAYQAWTTTFFNTLFSVYMNSGFNMSRVCSFLLGRYNVLKSKFDGTWNKPGTGIVQFGPRHRNTLAAKIYHIYFLMMQWGCSLPTNEQRDPLAGMDWMGIIESIPGVKSMVETTVMTQLNELKEASAAQIHGGDMGKPGKPGADQYDTDISTSSDMPMITPSRPVAPTNPMMGIKETKIKETLKKLVREAIKKIPSDQVFNNLNEKKVQSSIQPVKGVMRCVCKFPNGQSIYLGSTLNSSQCQQACNLKWQSMGGGTGKKTPDTGDLRYNDDMMDMDMDMMDRDMMDMDIMDMMGEKVTKINPDDALIYEQESDPGYGYVSSYTCQNPQQPACLFLTDQNFTSTGTGFDAWINSAPNGMNIKFMMKNYQGKACKFGNNVKNKLTNKLEGKGPDHTQMIQFKIDYIDDKLVEYNC